MDLTKAVALVTGGSAGIGRAIAQSLAASGARVAITGRDESKLMATAQALGASPVHADVSKEADVERTYREVLDKFGDLDILVNNAGSGVFKNLVDFDLASIRGGVCHQCNRRDADGPGSREAFCGAQTGQYCEHRVDCVASRRADGHGVLRQQIRMRGMTECWRAELRKHNIRVFLVNPSEVLTDFYPTAGLPQKANETKLRGEEIAHAVKAALEMDDRGFTTELTVFATNPAD